MTKYLGKLHYIQYFPPIVIVPSIAQLAERGTVGHKIAIPRSLVQIRLEGFFFLKEYFVFFFYFFYLLFRLFIRISLLPTLFHLINIRRKKQNNVKE